jgi:uncharacterized membrane protein (DUF373 family)
LHGVEAVMGDDSTAERMGRGFEVVIVRTMQVLLMIMTALAAVVLAALVVKNIRAVATDITSTEELHGALQRGFGGVLVVLLGLELLDTLKTYFSESGNRAQAVLTVALIAVGRHIVQLDFDHTQAGLLFGLAGVLLALTIGLFLVKKTGTAPG